MNNVAQIKLSIVFLLIFTFSISQSFSQPPKNKLPHMLKQYLEQIEKNPENDVTLEEIFGAVPLKEEQKKQIIENYLKLRIAQVSEMRQHFQSRNRSRNQQPQRRNIKQTIEKLNKRFLNACRRILHENQYDDWDACAAAIDLMPPRNLRGRGRAGTMLDPELGPEVGNQAPSFALNDLNGNKHSLEEFRGKPTVIEFGSYTCPIFRRKVEAIKSLRQNTQDEVNWMLIYTREAHPTDGWVVQANTKSGIEIPQHKSYEDRLQCAKRTQQNLNLNTTLLIDDMNNTVTKLYNGAPNHGYVLDQDGKIVSKQVWIEPGKVKKALESLGIEFDE